MLLVRLQSCGSLVSRLVILTLALLIFAGQDVCCGQEVIVGLPDSDWEDLVRSICDKIEQLYPVGPIRLKTRDGIWKAFLSGEYDGIRSPEAFAARLTEDMEKLSGDKHLDLYYAPTLARELLSLERSGGGPNEMSPSELEHARWENYGFKDLRMLDGRVGYLDLRLFFASRYAGSTAAAAMEFLSGSNAVIIDLRRNGGGWDSMVTLLAGYFVDTDDTEVMAITQSTLDKSYFASVVPAWVPGERFTDIPVYLLVSSSTASAAEAFASILKHLNDHVLLVGEKTAGAENPVEHVALDREFVLKIPCHKKVFFGDRSAWEGRGIVPDIEVESEQALETAHLHALRALMEQRTDDLAVEKIQWGLDGYRALQNPEKVGRGTLKSYAGQYRDIRIQLDEDVLRIQFGRRPAKRLLAISEDYFAIEGRDDLRVRFIDEEGKIVALETIYSDGYRSLAQRD